MQNPRSIPRRRFVKIIAAGAAALPVSSLCAATWVTGRPTALKLDEAIVADFTPHVGTRFLVDAGQARSVKLELLRAETLDCHAHAPGKRAKRAAFSLRFRGPKNAVLSQKIYALEHAQLGSFSLFLVPVNAPRKNGEMRYEAIFT